MAVVPSNHVQPNPLSCSIHVAPVGSCGIVVLGDDVLVRIASDWLDAEPLHRFSCTDVRCNALSREAWRRRLSLDFDIPQVPTPTQTAHCSDALSDPVQSRVSVYSFTGKGALLPAPQALAQASGIDCDLHVNG